MPSIQVLTASGQPQTLNVERIISIDGKPYEPSDEMSDIRIRLRNIEQTLYGVNLEAVGGEGE